MDNKENPDKNSQSNRLEAFLQNYGAFIGEVNNHPNDLETSLKDFSESIPAPHTDNQQILDLYNKSRNVAKEYDFHKI